MKRYVELSGRLENGLWSYQALPGLEKIIPEVRIETIATVRHNDFFASRLTMCTISGTYVEAGSHIIDGAKTALTLEQVAALPHAEACGRILTLDQEHKDRRGWVWADLGYSRLWASQQPDIRKASKTYHDRVY